MIKNKRNKGVTMKSMVTYPRMLFVTASMLFFYTVPADDNHLVEQAEAHQICQAMIHDGILSLPCNDTSFLFLHCLSALLDVNFLGNHLHKLIDDFNMPDAQNELCTQLTLPITFNGKKRSS